jgi:alpha-amylase
MRLRTLAATTVLTLAAGLLGAVSGSPPASAAPPGTRDVIATLFTWPWTSVANECTTVLGPRGYGGVQVSPPQESISIAGHPWWEVYQPASYGLSSRMGTRAQFASMIATCHAAGVKVYADAVINHMTGQGSTGYGGSTFTKYNYPGTYSPADFHRYPDHCPRPDLQISNYGNATEVQECELVSLSDLFTESSYVRGRIAAYLNDLRSLGVDGFRVDAAKHMRPADIGDIVSRLSGPAYVYQEVIYGAGEPITPAQYAGNGDLLEFRYGTALAARFRSGNIADLQTFGASWGMEPSGRAVVFVDNHDTQRNGSTLSYKDGALHTLATVFELGWNYGTPNIMSSYAFGDNDAGPPSGSDGRVSAVSCGTAWVCEHRRTPVANMVGFHNAVAGTAVTGWWSDGANRIGFGRAGKGYLAINKVSGPAYTRTWATGLPTGTYCDVIHGQVVNNACTGPVVSVDAAGNATFAVGGLDAVALHVGARVSGGGTAQVQVTFNSTTTTTWGQNVFVVGSVPALGGWDPAAAVPLSSAAYPVWRATVALPASATFSYKYLKKNPDGSVIWESDPNRSASTGTGSTLTINDSWR